VNQLLAANRRKSRSEAAREPDLNKLEPTW
jgi:hypothetical protein